MLGRKRVSAVKTQDHHLRVARTCYSIKQCDDPLRFWSNWILSWLKLARTANTNTCGYVNDSFAIGSIYRNKLDIFFGNAKEFLGVELKTW